jgi:protein O-mannosyl-transferase
MKKNILLVIAAFLASGIVLYSTILNTFFLSDDFHLLYSIKTNGPFGAWTGASWQFFRPIIALSLFVNYKLFGLNPAGYHLTNIIIHSLNSFLVFVIILLLVKKNDYKARTPYLAFFSGFLFLALPTHTEAVSWISGRCDVIAAFFFLASFYSYLRYKKSAKSRYLITSLFLFLCALLSKESVIFFPLLILLFEFYNSPDKDNTEHGMLRILRLPAIFCTSVIAYLLLRYLIIGQLVGGYGCNYHLNFNPALIFGNLFLYTIRSFFFSSIISLRILILIFITAVLACIIKFKGPDLSGKLKIIYFLMAAFAISLIPVINMGDWIGDTQSERFIYLPTVFASIAIIFLFNLLFKNEKAFRFVSVCLLLCCGLLLNKANENWVTAAKVSQSVLNSIKPLERPKRLLILNLVDNIHGAYIFRNGIKEAVYLFVYPGKVIDTDVFLYHNIFEKNDAAVVRKIPDGYKINLVNKRTFFYPVNIFGRKKSRYLQGNPEISDSFNGSFSIIEFNKLDSDDKLLFYSMGKMEQLDQ